MDSVDDSPLANQLYVALGRLVFCFTQIEESLQHAIWVTLGRLDGVRPLITGLTFRSLTEKFGAVYAERGLARPAHSDVAALCAHLLRLNDECNTLIHSAWGFWAESGMPMRTRRTSRGTSPVSLFMETVTPQQILDLSGRLKGADDKLWQLILQIGDQPGPVRSGPTEADPRAAWMAPTEDETPPPKIP
jgi:hypothetical protein